MQGSILDQETLDEICFDIDSVQWSTMCHCRSESAEKIPDLLYRYLGGLGEDVKEAQDQLWDSLQYQGSIFEPSSHATRFIVRALERVEEVEHQIGLVAWIAAMARGYTMTEGQGMLFWVAEDSPERPEVEAQYERELIWVKEVQIAAWQARDRLLELLESGSDRRLLIEVSHALVGLLNEGAAGVAPNQSVEQTAGVVSQLALDHVRQAIDPGFRCCMIAALGNLQALVPGNTWSLHQLLETDDHPGPRTIAALYLVSPSIDEGLGIDDGIADVLVKALQQREHHTKWLPQPWPWFFGRLRFHLIAALCQDGVSDQAFEWALEPILDVLRNELSPYTSEYDLAPVLARVFGDRVVTLKTRRDDLGAQVLRVLDSVFDNPEMWPNNIGSVDAVLRPFGLKNDQGFWARLLGRQQSRQRRRRWWWPFGR